MIRSKRSIPPLLPVTTAIECAFDLEIARACFRVGEYDEVEAIADRNLENPAVNDADAIAFYVLKACVRTERGLFYESLELLSSAGPRLDGAAPREKALFYGQRARNYVQTGKLDAALVDYEAARVWAQEAGDLTIEARIRNNLARQYGNAGRFDDAIQEVDAAIEAARRLDDESLLGMFYDQKAQILNTAERFSESLMCSERAIGLLESHPSQAEAINTHETALIGLLIKYCEKGDPLESFRVRRKITNSIMRPVDREVITLALQKCDGHLLNAAKLLGVHHATLLKVINKETLQSLQRRRYKKSLIKT